MKIVMLCDFFNESLEYQENLLAKYYIKHGHEVTIIASTFDSVFDYYADQYNKTAPERTYFHGKLKIIRLRYRINLLNRIKIFTSIYNILKQEKPDLIFVHDIALNILDAVRYKSSHPECKMILDYHADYSNSANNWISLKILHGVVRRGVLNLARRHLSKIFPIVPASALFLNEVYGVDYAEMELLPLGADTDLGAEVRERNEGDRLRTDYGIRSSDIVIFSGGKFAPAKKTELLIEAFKMLQRQDIHLFIVGEAATEYAEYKAKLETQAKEHSNIHFTGWLNSRDIYAHLDMADIAAFPASQSILWQQAISMGLPLVVGDVGHQDISYLNKYDNIFILRGAEISASGLHSKLNLLVNDEALRRKMSEGASRVTAELLNWDVLMQKTLQFNSQSAAS